MEQNTSKNIKRGIIWNSVSSFAKYALQFGGMILLARLLCPADYAMVGLLTVFISVADILIDSGLCGAIIKKSNAQKIDYSTLTTYNLAVSLLLYAGYFVAAPWVADWYGHPQLVSLMRCYALVLLIFALTIAPRARMTKDFEFKKLSIINIVSGTTALVVAIAMAMNGFGAFSIVGQYLTNAIVSTILILFCSRYRFSLGFSPASFREQFAFGMNTTVANTLKSVSENIYNNVIGKVSSLNQTGYYTQGLRLMNVPVGFFYGVIDNAYFPVMSQIHDHKAFRRKITQQNRQTLSFVLILFSVAIILCREIVCVMLGEKWIGIEWTCTMLLAAGLFITWGNLSRNIIKSIGKTFLILKYEIVIFLASITGLFFTKDICYEAIVSYFVFISFFKAILVNHLACKEIGMTMIQIMRPSIPLALLSLTLVAVTMLFHIGNVWLSLVLKSALCVVVYGCYMIYHLEDFRL